MLRPDYPIRTERLLLRPFDRDDAEILSYWRWFPELTHYTPSEPMTHEQALEGIASWPNALTEPGETLKLAIVEANTDRLAGEVLITWTSAEHRTGELGYGLGRWAIGHGYATEAARAMLALGFDGLRLHRIFARIDARNDASARVLQRLGMRREAYLVANEFLKGEWTDEADFAILRREWLAQRNAKRD